MKKNKLKMFIVSVTTILLPIITLANTHTTYSGLELSDQEYNNLLKIYTPERIEVLSQEKYDELMSHDFDFSDVLQDKKYIKSVYNSSLGITTETEISESEFNSASNNTRGAVVSGSSSYSSTMKSIAITLMASSSLHFVTLALDWKGIPSTRSFDVIGFRGFNFEFAEGGQSGMQIYKLNGAYNYIDYSWNGTNIKKFTNGFGISMNIVNSNISLLQATADCYVTALSSATSIYGAYEHAQRDMTLAQSQNYTLSGAGLGGVFAWPYSIGQYYDGMNGVYLSY